VAGGGGPGAGSGGEARALKRRSQRGVGTGGRVDTVALEHRGRRRGREGKKREGGKGGGPGRGGATWHGGAMGPGPDRRASPGSGPSVALTGDMRRARVPAGQSGERGS
jgi:hypothetical protein